MGEDQVTITLPMSAHGFGVLITVLAAALLSLVVFWMTGKGEPKEWFTAVREKMGLTGLHPLLVICLSLAWAALFLTLLTGIFWVLFEIGEKVSVSSEEEGGDLRWYLLTLTAVTAALGAVISLPFTLIKTALNRRQTETSEQGLITDRINKAVEGLGAVKEINRIGRSIETIELPPDFEPTDSEDAERLKHPPKRTEIQWQGEPSPVQIGETQGKVGQWEVFTSTEPNLEVRIGAIYALERISQDSARDHIQIMEILCAYIRQNAGRENVPLPDGDPTPEEWKAWADKGRVHPRLDVDVAMKVIERRAKDRKELEKKEGYRLGLERASLRKTLFSGRDFSGANFCSAELQATDLSGAILHAANLNYAQLQAANLSGAKLHKAEVRFANMIGADLVSAMMQGAALECADFRWANLWCAELQGAYPARADFRGAFLQNADLRDAQIFFSKLQGAKLAYSNLQGAHVFGAEFDQDTTLFGANLCSASVRFVDFQNAPQITDHVQGLFGDASVTLPGGHGPDHDNWPAHWPKFHLEPENFETQWRKWRDNPDNYTPPDPPEPDA